MRDRFLSLVRSRRGVVAAALLVVVGVSVARQANVVTGTTLDQALTRSLRSSGIDVARDSIMWVDDSSVLPRFVVFLGSHGSEPADLYAAQVRASGTTVLDVSLVTNVSRTPGALESNVVRSGDFVAYLSIARAHVEALTLVDLRGEPRSLTATWPARARRTSWWCPPRALAKARAGG